MAMPKMADASRSSTKSPGCNGWACGVFDDICSIRVASRYATTGICKRVDEIAREQMFYFFANVNLPLTMSESTSWPRFTPASASNSAPTRSSCWATDSPVSESTS